MAQGGMMEFKRLSAKNDSRGSLVEVFKLPHDGQIFYVVIKPGETRGNHYHLRKTEHFLVISGSAMIVARDRKTNETTDMLALDSHVIAATIPPNHTHKITATERGCLCLVWADEQFNEDDPDIYPEEV